MKKLFETPYFDVIQIEDTCGISAKTVSVAVLPYTIGSGGVVETIGVLHEWNELRDDKYANTLITGTIEDTDPDAYATAVRELWEEGGFDMRNETPDKWTFLGNFRDSKDSDRIIPTFAVDVTGLQKSLPTTDGSNKESRSSLMMMLVNEAVLTNELLLLGAFLRLFNILYHTTFDNGK